MTIIRILFFLLIPVFIYSVEIPGASHLEFGNRIEILHIEVNDYTFGFDSTITYLSIRKDSNDNNVYVEYKENDSNIKIHFPDTTTINYNLSKNYYFKFKSSCRKYFKEITNALYLIEDNSTYFINTNRHELDWYIYPVSMEYNYFADNEEMHVSISVGNESTKIKAQDSIILNLKDNSIYYLSVQNKKNVDNKEFFFKQYVYPSKNDSIFNYLADFYENGRHEIKPRPKDNNPPRKKKRLIKIGDTLDLNHQLIGVNRGDILFSEFVKKNNYTLIYNWGVWCGFCLDNTPNVKKINSLNLNDCSFITINCEGKRVQNDKVEMYVEMTKTEYPVFISCEALEKNGIYTYPQTTLIDSNGVVVDYTTGGGGDFELFEDFLIKHNLIDTP